MGKRHLTPAEIKEQCKRIARESRMADRLTRVEEYMNELLLSYQQDKTTVREWSHALLTEAGVVMELPVDPLTQTAGSIMTG